MCLATPLKIKKVLENHALLEDNQRVDISLVRDAKRGDWLLCHADLAINKLPEEEAKEILKLNSSCYHHKDINVSYRTSSSSRNR